MENQPTAPLPSQPPVVAPQVSSPTPVSPSVKSSSKSMIYVGILIVFILLMGGVIVYFYLNNKSTIQSASTSRTSNLVPTKAPIMTLTPGSGDPKLDQQTNAIDSNLKSLDADQKNVDQGLSDQQTDLSQ